jgi:argininosuccinate lyase
MLATLTMRPERMAEAAIGGFSLATDVADELARRRVPFREAHEIVGRLVAQCIAEGTTLEALTPAQWAEVHTIFADAPPVVTLEASVAARDVPGGTAPAQVQAAYAVTRAELDAARARAIERRTVAADLEQLLAVTDAVG